MSKAKKERRLAAVMFTDIFGYTALMAGDEDTATAVRDRHRVVFEELHGVHGGQIIQYYGDGTLSVFKSAVEAAQCAIDIQRLLQEGERPVPLRIGLHMGDIVFDSTDIYGDGVNLASRIESMSVPGAVLISGKLNDELKNHVGISTQSLGHYNFKNITGIVQVFAITNEGLVVPLPGELKGKQAIDKTIAVLPFVNMSASAENEYFSDGITEEIINALSRIKNLKVTSRTSSFFYKNRNIPIRQIGSELNVAAVLEGSVRLAGNTIRITAQLIDAVEDVHFWSETWDRKLENIFEIQDEISLAIGNKLAGYLGNIKVQDHLVGRQTESIDAYEYSLKAKYHFNKYNAEDMRIAITLFEQAIALDAAHTESYLGLAECYGFMARRGFMRADEAWGKSAQLTHQAYALNGSLPAVHYQMGRLAFFATGDYKAALAHTQKAAALNPNYVEALQYLCFLYIIAGEKEKAAHYLEQAIGLDPLSTETQFYAAFFHYMMEDYVEALEKLDKCLEQNSRNMPVHFIKCHCLLQLGRYDEVITYFDVITMGAVMEEDKVGFIALGHAMKKDAANTEKYFAILLDHAGRPDGFNADSYLFLMYAVSGMNKQAFEWVEEAVKNNSCLLLLRFADPLANGLRVDEEYGRYQEVIFGDKPIGQLVN